MPIFFRSERISLFWKIFVSVKWIWSIYLNFDEIYDDSSNKWLYRFYDKWKMTFYLHKLKFRKSFKDGNKRKKIQSRGWQKRCQDVSAECSPASKKLWKKANLFQLIKMSFLGFLANVHCECWRGKVMKLQQQAAAFTMLYLAPILFDQWLSFSKLLHLLAETIGTIIGNQKSRMKYLEQIFYRCRYLDSWT